ENNDTIVNTVWKYETNDLVIELRFDDAETCSISNGSKNAYSVNVRRYTYEQGYGVDMYFYEKTDDGKGATVFTGQFIKQNELTLFSIEENVATYEYATLKRIK
ncbi:MAG: hypothetical protein LBD87_01915, partial [Prevotellaceae bacterium]|nr:hypothetical protein [Prevotellaceae bacterium]